MCVHWSCSWLCPANCVWRWSARRLLFSCLMLCLNVYTKLEGGCGEGGQDVAFSGPFDDEWEDVTCSILSPGCRAEAAGPSCCTLVTKIPYKSKWYTVRTTQGHDGLESLPFSFSSQYPPPPTTDPTKKITFLPKIYGQFINTLSLF